jgi:prophage regulatory protein
MDPWSVMARAMATAIHTDPLAHLRVLTMKQVTELTSYTAQHIYRLERAGKFPSRIRMGENRVGWRLADVEGWFASRPTVAPRYIEEDLR